MKQIPTITRIDHNDPRSQAALDAEQRYFAHYGLDYKVHFVELQNPNLRVRVLEVGEGRPLLMIPGGSGDAVFYAALAAELKGWRMVIVNRPGGGLSDGIDHRQVDVRQFAVKTLQSVMDAFDLQRVPVVCNSMGGLWGLWLALDVPERVSRLAQMGCPALILDTSAPFFMRLLSVPGVNRLIAPNMQPREIENALHGLSIQGSRAEDIAAMPKAAADVAYHFFNLPTYLETWTTLISAVATVTGAKPNYQMRADELQRVQQPVQFVWGDNDPFGGLEVARRVKHLMPNADLHEMRAGHLPFLDKPQECGRVIRDFLSKEMQ
ncbi:MAG: hypothetical protein DPW18_12480 [Chloroflexi bacterium]|nr:hypothetical protein [Chloroflexota bacterium]MDL1941708.1 alpha/beta hydrolase [Chloroflexi bacterium CFX2]